MTGEQSPTDHLSVDEVVVGPHHLLAHQKTKKKTKINKKTDLICSLFSCLMHACFCGFFHFDDKESVYY